LAVLRLLSLKQLWKASDEQQNGQIPAQEPEPDDHTPAFASTGINIAPGQWCPVVFVTAICTVGFATVSTIGRWF
jgi:hypothetical protein